MFCIPCTHEVNDPREKDSLGNSKKDADGEKALVILNSGSAATYCTPNCSCGANVCTKLVFLLY